MSENYFKATSESQNFIDYFKAVNPTFLNNNVKALFIVKAHDKVYLKSVFTKEEYLNKFSYVTTFTTLERVIDTCDSDENPEGQIFEYKLPSEQLIDFFVNLGEECLIQIFEDELIAVDFLVDYYEAATV